MASRKHELLKMLGSEDESDRGYNSEENVAESKGRAVKRRRTADTQDPFGLGSDEEDSDINEDSEEESRPKGKGRKQTKTHDTDEDEDEDELEAEEMDDEEDGGASLDDTEETSGKPKSKLLNKKLAKLASGKPPKKDKSGVVYLSSLPPYLKPFALKNMLEKRNFGPITKVFLAPLLPSAAGQKQKSNKRKLYTDGWVEFKSKRTAKLCAETLNARTIGGLKSSWYRDDLWNMKYLKGYKWANLMEQIQMERATREATQRMADQKAKREDKVYISGVESGRIADGIQKKEEEKRKRRLEAEQDDGEAKPAQKPARKIRRTFEQSKAVKSDGKLADDTQRVLGKIF
ncbi:hypothetical protein N7541_000338 [Penicillium brevicompactum]|uniref:Pre-rRNA-processing protein ESF2 n=1 Tax=Penicillium brevicompactum TaxID=5074 RepID=A0A9W9RTX0_PENBR|nr:hypothetical protein N7541_000338 [Penicillium brevicompactum]